MSTEYELKYAATAPILQELRQQYPGKTISMVTTYYDTRDSRLSAFHCTLRVRQENEDTVCTLKTPGPQGARCEWEFPCHTLEDGLRQILTAPISPTLRELLQQPLVPCCGAEFTRQAAVVSFGQSVLELALDQGFLLGKTRRIPLCEVEVELKSGSRADADGFAAALQQAHALKPEEKSKFARAREAG